MDIYIKPRKKVSVVEQESICIRDIAEVFVPSPLLERVRDIVILKPDKAKKKSYLITVIDIIGMIDKTLPGHTINNVGEMDTIVDYAPKATPNNPILTAVKILFVAVVFFAGSATAIMSFHSDAEMNMIFENYYYIFFHERISHPLLLDLPYSIGIAFGIIVFFNHFTGKKITEDPTPIEVEFSSYETKVNENLIQTLQTQRVKEEENGDA